jgi:hypothetical protein
MWRPALAAQIHPHQQAPPTEEITTMSVYGDIQFIQAETEARFERGRTAPWIAGRAKTVRRRLPMRRHAAETIDTRQSHAA